MPNPCASLFFTDQACKIGLCLLLGALLLYLPNVQAAKVSFARTQLNVPKTVSLFVTTTDIETGNVVDSVQTQPRANVSIGCQSRFCVAAAHGSGIAKVRKKPVLREYFGVSRAFGPKPFNSASRRVVRIKGQTVATTSSVQANIIDRIESVAKIGAMGFADTDPPTRVAVPNDAFQLSGTVAQETISRGIAAMIITGMAHSPCYNRNDSFVVVESDSRIQAMRQREFDLIKKGFAAADPSFVDRSKPANVTVRGTVSSQGGSATVTIEMVNASGAVIGSSNVSVSNGGWLSAVGQASLDLGGQLCSGPQVEVQLARCQLKKCSCGSNSSGYQVVLRMDGTAKLPIGGIVFFTIPNNASAVQNCGGVTSTTLAGSALACQRSSAEQPETFSWTAQSSTPAPPSCQCPGDGAPQSMMLIATAFESLDLWSGLPSGQRDDKILQDVACSQVE